MSENLQQKLKHYRLNSSEYEMMKKLLGREPQGVEWALFSALWSEHCSYKSSKIHLRKFSYRNNNIMEGEGENAGIVNLGYGEKIAFKMESHNHPSFIEPYQGAATGVGGILRDIFTMGARPIALADYLCFGEINADRMKTLVNGVVAGISGYGNCVGVPTVTGQTEFHPTYNKNILVNAMAVGLLTEKDPIALSKAEGPGNWVVYVGAKTGKDGVHGASMASESFDDKNEAKKPNVQIGDPFFEKLLIESCLEILKQNLVVAMQDMGAAGLTSSSFEMASKGQVGFVLDLDQVPQRDSSITPEEILLSESQERMLLVCEPKNFKKIEEVFARWGLDAKKIGEVQAERRVTLQWKGEVLASIDPDLLVENAPRYERPYQAWSAKNKVSSLPTGRHLKETLLGFLSHPMGTAKKSIYRQYDQRVGLRTIRGAEQSVAFQRLPSARALAIAVGCRPALMKMDAQVGAYDAVFYPALQMAAKGARALAVTDCLNFGNPEKIEIMSEFVTSVESIAEAAKLLDAPVISGNVSFYNETLGQNITSTPATGLVGLRDQMENIPSDQFSEEGDLVYWLRLPLLSSFATLEALNGKTASFTGAIKPELASQFISVIRQLSPYFSSSKVVGKGGLAYTLSMMSLGEFSFHSHSQKLNGMGDDEFLAENLYEVVVSIPSAQKDEFEKQWQKHADRDMEMHWIGFVGQGNIQMRANLVIPREEITQRYGASYEAFMA
jgi:phosphoribosylformylglycinamidine synthase